MFKLWNILYYLKSLVYANLNRKLLNLNIQRMVVDDKNSVTPKPLVRVSKRGDICDYDLCSFLYVQCLEYSQCPINSDGSLVPLPKSIVLYRIQEELREAWTWGGKRLSPHLLPFGLTEICVYSSICPAYTSREMEAESRYPRITRNIGLSVISSQGSASLVV